MSAIVAGRLDGPAAAAEVNANAIALAENSDDPLPGVGSAHCSTTSAGTATTRERTTRRWTFSAAPPGTARTGPAARDRDRALVRRAVSAQPRAVRRSAGDPGRAGRVRQGLRDGYVYEEIGENLLSLGRGDEAATYFSRAHELLSGDDWLVDNERDRLERLLFLSDD